LFGAATLALISSNPELHERLSVVRASEFEDRDFVVFGARTKSTWAADVLVGRLTDFAYDWPSFRAMVLRVAESGGIGDSALEAVPLDRLYAICELLHERNMDAETERALLRIIGHRAAAGSPIPHTLVEPLIERLLQAGLADLARELLPRTVGTSWLRHAFSVELRHPRFGGTFDSMLELLNEPYRRLALESVTLEGEGGTPFERLHAKPQAPARPGPLVTVIMTCWRPDPGILAAVRSIIGQTYQNWELIVTDDASPAEWDEVLEEVAALDPRIRVVRNDTNAGTYVRRNEAIDLAKGEFVTMQDSDDWAHPHRLEIQVRDLLDNPTRLANVVHAARATEDFSVVSARGARLFLAEPSLMFRRLAVVEAIGYYDSIRKSADTEFRKRLEAVTKRHIPTLLPGAPLQFMLADASSLSGADFGTNIWNHPDRLTYWSATNRYLQRIESGLQDPYLAFPQGERVFHAPPSWAAQQTEKIDLDLVVVVDGREHPSRADFHGAVVDELKAAAAAGLHVGVLQSDAIGGPRGMAFFPADLQALVDSGVVLRVGAHDAVRADVAVIRHAGAAQGHPTERIAVSASRVVVVEDAAAGDVRGRTIARADVTSTVKGWFGVTPTWVVAPPSLPTPAVISIACDADRVRVTTDPVTSAHIRAIRLSGGEQVLELEATATVASATTWVGAAENLVAGDWTVLAECEDGDGQTTVRLCLVTPATVIWNHADRIIIRTDEGRARILTERPGAELLPGSREFAVDYLSASISSIRVAAERCELTLASGTVAAVGAVYALREVEGGVVRRRDFTAAAAQGPRVWARPLAKFAESRWRVFGTFRTPLGMVEFPISLDSTAVVEGTENWQPQILSGGRLLIAPPPASKVATVARRVVRAVDSRLGGTARAGNRVGRALGGASSSKIYFGPQHSAARLKKEPAVSVVMPVYNVEPYLDVAIASVLGQDFTDLELIIVDDASTDNGRRIIAKHWRKDPRVRVFGLDHNTIGGAGVPSNIGLRAARGKYVAFADSDDHITKGGLAKLVELAEAHSAELVIGDFRTFTDKLKDGAEPYDRRVWDEIPLNAPISAFSHPALFSLSPVPWRKLYRNDFLRVNDILYPEGDYFYEDNPLHWFVLSRAHRVVACDEVISFHRQEREGATMSAQAYKLGAFVNHANTILNFLEKSTDDRRDVLFEAFFGYLDRSDWTVKRQSQPAAAALIRRGLGDVYQRAIEAAPAAQVPPLVRPRLATYRSAYPDIDLTVVIPVYNSADLVGQTIDSVLALSGLRFNVLLVDDGSTDDSLAVMREYERRHPNVHVFAQGNRGAGRARNSVIPLSTGRYTYFLDADDLIEAEALGAAVAQADAESADLVMVKYRIEYTDEDRTQGMFGGDRQIWDQLPQASNNAERQKLAAKLINYPWNRVIRTSLLHDANIFFGATVVHNDVQFHWHSVTSATNIGYMDVEVCTHRKFATRDQVTNISDARRLAVLEALRATHERISQLPSYPDVQNEWEAFALHLLEWAKTRIPDALQARYGVQSEALAQSFAR
jgi:glycosyltransferase involved in cell wall biosynthesis